MNCGNYVVVDSQAFVNLVSYLVSFKLSPTFHWLLMRYGCFLAVRKGAVSVGNNLTLLWILLMYDM